MCYSESGKLSCTQGYKVFCVQMCGKYRCTINTGQGKVIHMYTAINKSSSHHSHDSYSSGLPMHVLLLTHFSVNKNHLATRVAIFSWKLGRH